MFWWDGGPLTQFDWDQRREVAARLAARSRLASSNVRIGDAKRTGPCRSGCPVPALDIAQLYEALGSSGMARATLERYVEAPHTPGQAEYLKTYLEEAGDADLAARIVASPVNAE